MVLVTRQQHPGEGEAGAITWDTQAHVDKVPRPGPSSLEIRQGGWVDGKDKAAKGGPRMEVSPLVGTLATA